MEKWLKGINPKTNKKIKIGGKIWKKIGEENNWSENKSKLGQFLTTNYRESARKRISFDLVYSIINNILTIGFEQFQKKNIDNITFP